MSKQRLPKNSSHAQCFARVPHFARSFFRTLSFRAHSSFCTFFFFFACTLTSHALLSGAGAMVSFGSCSSERCLKCVQFCPQLLSAKLYSVTIQHRFCCPSALNLQRHHCKSTQILGILGWRFITVAFIWQHVLHCISFNYRAKLLPLYVTRKNLPHQFIYSITIILLNLLTSYINLKM